MRLCCPVKPIGQERRHDSRLHPYDPAGGRSAGGPQGRAQFGLLDLPEPVVSADSDFNRGVSLNEFKSAAAKRFSALDVDHRGLLTLDVLETLRPPEPRREKRDPDAPPDIDANADTSPG